MREAAVRTISLVLLAAIFLIFAARPANAVDIDADTLVFGFAGGLGAPQGGAGKTLGRAGVLGGQALYLPDSTYAVGMQVDRFDFKSKGTTKADMTSIMAVLRGNYQGSSEKYLPYVLCGLGFAESRADIPGGTDHGGGAGFLLGLGVDRMMGPFSAAVEVRLHRLGAPLPHLGLSGATVFDFVLRLNLWVGPPDNPFRKS